jgi:radical SAM superfamily enzyme YgiQ (UPF0313 family)
MRILYVNPGKIEAGLDAIIKGPPLALLTIAAMVPEHEATLFDFKVDRYTESGFKKLLQSHDVVAITSMTPQITSAFEIADKAKVEGCVTILGGYHPTLAPDECINHPSVDYIVRGEGEHTFKELIDYIDHNRRNIQKSEIKGISFKDATGHIVHNLARPLESNLDVFPIPRRELLHGKKYSYLGARVMLMETSRGCPHDCAFCCIIKMWNDDTNHMRYRTKSLKRIMQELYTIEDNWDFVFFNDDNFTINIKRTEKILDWLIKSGMNKKFLFSCQSRVDTFYRNPWLAEKMEKAGFRQVFFGIESVHQQSLDAMHKHTNPDMIRTACKMATDHGISIFGGMIIGFPGETPDMVRENIDFAISLGLDFVQFTPITAFPGTPFFAEMKTQGKIATEEWKYYNLFHSMMRTDELSRNEMYELVSEGYQKFYVNRKYMGKMMQRAFFVPKFAWYRKISFRWLKQVVFGGYGMLKAMGMLDFDRTKNIPKTDASKSKFIIQNRRQRWHRFRVLMADAQQRGITLKSPKLAAYVNSK